MKANIEYEISEVAVKYKKKLVNRRNKSIMDAKAFTRDYYNNLPVKSTRTLTEQYMKLASDCNQFYFFITLTFGKSLNIYDCCTTLNKFIHKYNQKLFGNKYDKRDVYMEGYAFFEKHTSLESRNKFHVHILLKHDDEYDKFSFDEHIAKFQLAARKIQDDWKKPVFNSKAIHIRYAVETDIEYCFKQIYDKNLNRFKVIDKTGISDDSFDF